MNEYIEVVENRLKFAKRDLEQAERNLKSFYKYECGDSYREDVRIYQAVVSQLERILSDFSIIKENE